MIVITPAPENLTKVLPAAQSIAASVTVARNVTTILTERPTTEVRPALQSITLKVSPGQGPAGPPGPSGGVVGTSPEFTYVAGVLTRVDYSNGVYKTFSYASGKLSEVRTHLLDSTIQVRTFIYDQDDLLRIEDTIE